MTALKAVWLTPDRERPCRGTACARLPQRSLVWVNPTEPVVKSIAIVTESEWAAPCSLRHTRA